MLRRLRMWFANPYLGEANVGGLLAEALTADVQAVLADETGLVGADTAVKRRMLASVVSTISMSIQIYPPLSSYPISLLSFSSSDPAKGCFFQTYQPRAPLP